MVSQKQYNASDSDLLRCCQWSQQLPGVPMRPWRLVADCCNTLRCRNKGAVHIMHDGTQIKKDLHKNGGSLFPVVSPFKT